MSNLATPFSCTPCSPSEEVKYHVARPNLDLDLQWLALRLARDWLRYNDFCPVRVVKTGTKRSPLGSRPRNAEMAHARVAPSGVSFELLRTPGLSSARKPNSTSSSRRPRCHSSSPPPTRHDTPFTLHPPSLPTPRAALLLATHLDLPPPGVTGAQGARIQQS